MTLAVIMGAYQNLHTAVGLHSNCGRLEESHAGPECSSESRRRHTRGFHVTGNAEAAQRFCLGCDTSTFVEPVIIGNVQEAGKDLGKIAAVVGRTDRRL